MLPIELIEDESGNKTPAVPLDLTLAAGTSGAARNQLDLTKTVTDGDGKIFPVWRLRYDGDDDTDSSSFDLMLLLWQIITLHLPRVTHQVL